MLPPHYPTASFPRGRNLESVKNTAMAQNNNYQLLINKLDAFIRKYYLNQIIRGTLYSLALIVALFVAFNLLEYYFYFGQGARKTMFYSFLGVSAVALTGWVLLPLTRYFRLGRVISHEQAAGVIGDHFGNVQDKLLNILQLKNQADANPQAELITASINQKSEEIKVVPFKKAIDLSKNRKYLRYALPPLLLLLLIMFVNSALITDSTTRLINNDRDFARPAPFHFTVDKDDLSVVQFEDYVLTVKAAGEVLPNEVFIDTDNYQYRLNKEDANTFTYRFSNVQKETQFKLFSGAVSSETYELDVLKKPNITGFEVKLDYPNYLGRANEALNSIGDLVVPVGTNIDWIFNSQNTDDITVKFAGAAEKVNTTRFSDELFTYKKRAMRDESYKLYMSNAALPDADSISYTITVVPDQYPTIKAEKFQDSLDSKLLFFVGDASDDYGVRNLTFNYRIKSEKGQQGEIVSIPVRKPTGTQVNFDYTFDVQELTLTPGDEVSYYFEVFDNDGVNGAKSARTNLMLFEMPTVEEFEEMEEENEDKIKDKLKDALDETKKIQEDMQKMREKLLQEKDLDWQDKKELQKMLDRQKELQKEIEEAKDAFEENLKNQEEFSETEENIQKKQEQIQKMFEESLSEEMKDLMKQIEELLQELDKEQALEQMEEMEMNDEQLETELDRMLEMFKELELENEMQKTIEKLEELAEKQEELAEQTQNEEKPQEELQKEQEEINKEFEDIQEKMDEIKEKNEELESPKNIDQQEEQQEEIKEDLQDSKENLEQKQNSKAGKKQKSAAGKMKEMAQKMAMDMQSQEQEQMEEDMAALRQLLENLVGLSFEQEDLIEEFSKAKINTPHYTDLTQHQFKLKDDFVLVEDSLRALAKRVYQIETFVTEKVFEIKRNMKGSIDNLEERRIPQAATDQQYAMKNLNDLALMLSEVMDQMQQQMSGQMPGSQMCNNPGGSKPGAKPSDKPGGKPGSEGQKGLGEKMKKMADAMKNGKGGTSKEFAELAAKQAALREALRKKQAEKQSQGQGDKELQELIDQMNKNEIDLVNKRLTNEMLKRQEEIMTKLLKHEKAERERELDNKRKSETARAVERKMPPSLEEYIKKREAETEMYKTVSPALRPYYKQLVEEYFKSLENG